MYRVKERLYLTEDRLKIVGEGAREGRFLFAKPGDDLPDEVARKYGLLKEKLKEIPQEKMIRQPENKSVKSGKNDKEEKEGK